MNKIRLIILILIITGVGLILFRKSSQLEQENQKSQIEPTMNNQKTTDQSLPKMEIDKTKKYTAILKTEKGDISIMLNADKTPLTVNNFISLSRKGFYNNTVFHRVVNGFMIQGGDPKGDGTGGPDYQFDDEPFTGEYTRGTIAMANAGPNTNGSQFFILHQNYDLPKNYVIFGQVESGIEVVDAIASAPVKANELGEMSIPEKPVRVLSVEIKEE